jgi:hypothetical protein
MTEFESEVLRLLRDIADGLVRASRPRGAVRWTDAEDLFAAVVKGMVELGLTHSRLRTHQLIAAAADRPALREAFVAVAAPVEGPADAIDPLRLGKWFSDRERENQVVTGWRLMVDRSNRRKPRWYLARAGGEGV